MSLHGLTSITLGVPDVEAASRYYEEFGRRAARSAAANDVKGDHCEQHAKSTGVAALASHGHPASQRFRVAGGRGANNRGRRVSGPKSVSVG